MLQTRSPSATLLTSIAPISTAIPLCGDCESRRLRMPIPAIQGSKAGGAAGTNFTAGWSKLRPLLPFPTKKQAVEVAAHAMLPEAVLTLPRKRELMLINARRAEGGDPSPSPRLAGGRVSY